MGGIGYEVSILIPWRDLESRHGWDRQEALAAAEFRELADADPRVAHYSAPSQCEEFFERDRHGRWNRMHRFVSTFYREEDRSRSICDPINQEVPK